MHYLQTQGDTTRPEGRTVVSAVYGPRRCVPFWGRRRNESRVGQNSPMFSMVKGGALDRGRLTGTFVGSLSRGGVCVPLVVPSVTRP